MCRRFPPRQVLFPSLRGRSLGPVFFSRELEFEPAAIPFFSLSKALSLPQSA